MPLRSATSAGRAGSPGAAGTQRPDRARCRAPSSRTAPCRPSPSASSRGRGRPSGGASRPCRDRTATRPAGDAGALLGQAGQHRRRHRRAQDRVLRAQRVVEPDQRRRGGVESGARSRSSGPMSAWPTISSSPSPARMRRTRCRGSLGSGRYGGSAACGSRPAMLLVAVGAGHLLGHVGLEHDVEAVVRHADLEIVAITLHAEAERRQQLADARRVELHAEQATESRPTLTATRRWGLELRVVVDDATRRRRAPVISAMSLRRAVRRKARQVVARSPSRGACSPRSAGRGGAPCCGSSGRGRSPTRG